MGSLESGRAYRALGDPIGRLHSSKGIERNPADQESLYMLGQVLLALGRGATRTACNGEYQSLQERLSRTNSLFESAIERAQSGELDQAEALEGAFLHCSPICSGLKLWAPSIESRKYQGALEMLKQAQIQIPLNSETYFQLGTAYLRSGKLSRGAGYDLTSADTR
jgi:tetratricopeptide (TPR) repeat protein